MTAMGGTVDQEKCLHVFEWFSRIRRWACCYCGVEMMKEKRRR